jgi:outer membrane receptor for ferrienterochelin and colicins
MRPLGGAVLGILVAAATAQAQVGDFFEEKETYFRPETIEGVSKHAESLSETPATVTLLDREAIERYGFRTVADVLNFASLGDFTYSDRRYDFAGGRGLFFFEDFNTRILIMLNGHPLNEPWNNFGGVGREMAVPLALAERVEIIYGPSSLLYGGYSLYGIVNVVTQNGEGAPGARLRLSGGSWHTGEALASYGRSGTTGKTSWNFLVAAGYESSSGESLDLPRQEVDYTAAADGSSIWGGPSSGADFERSPFAFAYGKRGDFSILLRSGFRKHGDPFGPYGSVYGSADEFVQDTKSLGEIRWEKKVSARVTLSARAFYDDYTYQEQDPYLDALTYPGQSGYRFVLHTHDWDRGGEARVQYQGATHFVTVGGEYRGRWVHQRASNVFADGSDAPDSRNDSTVTGHLAVAYAQEEWRPVARLALIAGVNVADTEPGGSRAQPRAAVVVKPRPNLSVKALYNEGFRPPSIFEAAYFDSVTQIQNPSLRSERIRSGELSTLWNVTSRIAAQGYAFTSRLQGLIRNSEILAPADIQGGVTGPTGDPSDLVGEQQYQSQGDVRSSGAGLAVRAKVARRWEGYLNVAYAKARQRPVAGGEQSLPASSSWLGSAGLSYDGGTWSASTTARYVGAQDLDPQRGLDTRAGDFVEANARLTLRTRVVYPVRVDFDVRNLFDAKGAYAASFIYTPATLPIEGRRFLLSSEIRF